MDFVPSKNTVDFNFLSASSDWISYSQEESKSQDLLSSITQEKPVVAKSKTTCVISIPLDLAKER